jgi:hypothetical protein
MILKRSQEECSKFAPDRRGLIQGILLKEVLKETLGQILRIVRIIPPTARKRVKWVPVPAAQLRQGVLIPGTRSVAR